jgi:hypothetical protein
LRGRLISTGMCQTENGAGNSAVPVHLRVEPASTGAGGSDPLWRVA